MYKKEVNERSPLRVFERSIHGGLGRGNVGVVMSRAGVGKTAFLVDIALDDLMRDRKVLHINIDDAVDRVREFYDEIFADLVDSAKLQERDRIHLAVERNRLIQTFSRDSFAMDKVEQGIALAREHMAFDPDVVIIDGYPSFSVATEAQVQQIKDLAKTLDAEVWIAARARRDDERDARGVPQKVARFGDLLSVIVELESAADHVRLNLRKDHDSDPCADVFLELDPRTLLLRWR
jgi:hypothetical protein